MVLDLFSPVTLLTYFLVSLHRTKLTLDKITATYFTLTHILILTMSLMNPRVWLLVG